MTELCNLSLEIQGPCMGEGDTPILRHGRKVHVEDPHFCDFRSNLFPIV